MGLVLHINGWPGTGKLTIARLLARRLDARLLDNHTLINPAQALLAREDPGYYPLRQQVRGAVFSSAAALPEGATVILTDAIGDVDPRHRRMFEDCVDLASALGAPILSVVLDCSLEENLRRLVRPGRRRHLKLTDPEILAALRGREQLLRPTHVPRLDLDVTDLSAAQVARRILRELRARLGART